MPLTKRAGQGVRPNPDNQKASQEVTVDARPARLATTNITNWKLEQQKDPVLHQVVKHRKASRETFKEALLKVTYRKAVSAYVKSKDKLIMKNSLLYQQSKQGQMQGAFSWFRRLSLAGFLTSSEACTGLGNGCERFCMSRPLLGSYVHQESI